MWGATAVPLLTASSLKFQSTHPCGVRRNIQHDQMYRHTISIHAPMWGATVQGTVVHGRLG